MSRFIGLGVRAHDFGRLPLEHLVRKVRDSGFATVQFAPYKVLKELEGGSKGFDLQWANRVKEVFDKHNIGIAVLGCYINLVDVDLEERQKALQQFKEHLQLVKALGCELVATETGSLNRDQSYHPENSSQRMFDEVVRSIKELVEEAERQDVIVGIEGVIRHTIFSPQRIRELLNAVPSKHLQIVFDPVNLIDGSNHVHQDRILRESVELFGDRIRIVHLKDYTFEDGTMRIVAPGKGLLNYQLLSELLQPFRNNLQCILEGVAESDMEHSRLFLNALRPSFFNMV